MWCYTEEEQNWLSAPAQPLKAKHFPELTAASLDFYLERAREARAGFLLVLFERALSAAASLATRVSRAMLRRGSAWLLGRRTPLASGGARVSARPALARPAADA